MLFSTFFFKLGYDNTLHTLPVAWIFDRVPSYEHFHLAAEKITSFIVPFAGPHECPNSKTCPNNLLSASDIESSRQQSANTGTMFESTFTDYDFNTTEEREMVMSNGLFNSVIAVNEALPNNNPEDNDGGGDQQQQDNVNNGNPEQQQPVVDPCPYPTSVVWWKTLNGKHCAIVGYSDGTICIVGMLIIYYFITYFYILIYRRT